MAFSASIPSPDGNPFISVTTLPEGTLFIVFGAIFLGLFVLILGWRVWALWASHRAAANNEARFTAIDRAYGGPFVDPVVADSDSVGEKSDSPRLHPVGVPLGFGGKAKARRARPKSQADRVREAQLEGRFFSPTVEVLTHGSALPPGAGAGTAANRASFLPSGYYNRTSTLLPDAMAQSEVPSLTSLAQSQPPTGPISGPISGPRLSVQQTGRSSVMQHSIMSNDALGASSLSTGHPAQPRAKKIRPPSTYLDDLIGN